MNIDWLKPRIQTIMICLSVLESDNNEFQTCKNILETWYNSCEIVQIKQLHDLNVGLHRTILWLNGCSLNKYKETLENFIKVTVNAIKHIYTL
jgi:hypothetical protein